VYEIKVKGHFDAAHYLLDYQGPCAHMHGHTWTVETAVVGDELGPSQLLIDFHDLRDFLQDIIAPFDHCCLNELDDFKQLSPTSENIARLIYHRLGERLDETTHGVRLSWVSVSESPDTGVVYREED
jgi:6-pyruvoyltetrahydropterin/6-carboxytetrahydropterin synthase